jgi:EAL domain-containing protein (putative c-di-GMP-specific phosphodiesterase class I)
MGGGICMTTIVNCVALIVLAINMIFFFSNRYLLTKASHYYRICLILTLITAIVNTIQTESLEYFSPAPWIVKLCITADYALMIFTTTVLALYLICKICEHVHTVTSLFNAHLSLIIIFVLACITLLLNVPYGFIFTFNKAGILSDGTLPFLPYFFLFPQISVVFAYTVAYKKYLMKSVKLAFIESIFAAALCICISIVFDGVSILILAIVLIELIFFLNFQNFRTGVNSLTNLNGERGFSKEVNGRIKSGNSFKAYLIKLRNHAIIKQNYGHRAGNEILYLFAFNLEKLFHGEVVFHLHGTTFSLILPHISKDESDKDTEKLINYLEKNIEYRGNTIKLEYTLSENIHTNETNADIFYEKMEYACEIARKEKRKYIFCTPQLDESRTRMAYLINRMQAITVEAGFELWFQPIYRVATKSFTNMEVLLRLKEKDGSYISPGEFIPIAENTGQIIPITEFVIKETCRILSDCNELSSMKVSINLPMIQLTDPSFEKKLDEIVDRYGISHDRINFEFTERVILDDLDVAEKNMRRLARSGYSFYLDDFGIGYSNFNCVLRLPLRTIKLDMSLTSTTKRLSENFGIVNVLTDLFHNMGLTVVAEGAETSEQVQLLKLYGVDGIQGYYFARPMPLEKLIKFLEENDH